MILLNKKKFKLNNETSTGNKLHFSGLPGRKIAPLELRALERPRSQQKFCRPNGQTKPPAALGCLVWTQPGRSSGMLKGILTAAVLCEFIQCSLLEIKSFKISYFLKWNAVLCIVK